MRSFIKREKFIREVITYPNLPDVYVYKVGAKEVPRVPNVKHDNINEALHKQYKKFKNPRIIFYEPET